MASSLFLWFWLNKFLPKMPMLNRLILTATSGHTVVPRPGEAGSASRSIWPPVGAVGRATSELKPGGSAEFFDAATEEARHTSVVSENGFLPQGTEVIVREVNGPTVVVRKRV